MSGLEWHAEYKRVGFAVEGAPVAIHSCIHGSSATVGTAFAVTAAGAFRLPGLCFSLVLIVGSFVCSSVSVC